MTFGVEAQLPSTLAAMPTRTHTSTRSTTPSPGMEAQIVNLLDAVHVREIDPAHDERHIAAPGEDAIGDGRRHRRRVFVYQNWAPPQVLMYPLPEDRRAVYFARFAERSRSGGWLVQYKDTRQPSPEWYHDLSTATHRVTELHDHGYWKLSRFEAKTPRR